MMLIGVIVNLCGVGRLAMYASARAFGLSVITHVTDLSINHWDLQLVTAILVIQEKVRLITRIQTLPPDLNVSRTPNLYHILSERIDRLPSIGSVQDFCRSSGNRIRLYLFQLPSNSSTVWSTTNKLFLQSHHPNPSRRCEEQSPFGRFATSLGQRRVPVEAPL